MQIWYNKIFELSNCYLDIFINIERSYMLYLQKDPISKTILTALNQ